VPSFSRCHCARAMPRHFQKRIAKHQTGKACSASVRSTSAVSCARNNKGKRNADRRVVHEPRHANECHHSPALRARRGPIGGRSSVGVPPRRLRQRPNAAAQLQLRTSWDQDVIRCYLHLACPFSPAGRPAVPVVVPDGRNARSRPGAQLMRPRPQEPLLLRQPRSAVGVLLRKQDMRL